MAESPSAGEAEAGEAGLERALQEIGPRTLEPIDMRLLDDVRRRVLGRHELPRSIDRFTVLEEIGRGGMGTVYAVYDPRLDRRIALKVLLERGEAGRDAVLAEARMLARVAHPNVAAVHDVGEIDGQVYLSMELVQGVPLPDWLAETARGRDAVVSVIDQAGRGLAAAHAAGLVHRDFKPSNVVVGEDGRARVIDFGLALELAGSERPATIAGTPAYMAPEQRRGEGVDARADQYALCLVAAEALGAVRGDDGAPVLSGLPPRLGRALSRGLHADPARRYADLPALLTALSQASRARWSSLAAVVGAGVLVATFAYARRDTEVDACPTVPEFVETAWSAEQRDAVAQGLVGDDGEPGQVRASRVMDRLESGVSGWAEASAAVCRESGEGPPTALRQCLRLWSVEFDELTTLLSQADEDLRLRAPKAVAQLGSWERCRNPASLPEPAASPEATAIREELARVRARLVAGDSVDGRSRAERAVEQARDLGDRWVEAEAVQLLGRSQSYDRDFEASIRTLTDAATLAIELQAGGVLGDAAAMLSYSLMQTREPARGMDWVQVAKAARSRQGLAPFDSELVSHEASLLNMLGRPEDSIALYEAALAELEPGDDRGVVMLAGNLVASLHAVGRADEAREQSERALAAARRFNGPVHPAVATLLLNQSALVGLAGDHEAALVLVREAHDMRVQLLGEDHPGLASTLQRQAAHLQELDRHAEALVAVDAAIPLLEASYGERNLEVGSARMVRASAWGMQGARDEAWREYQAAVAILEQARAPDEDLQRAYVWASKGALAVGAIDQAVAWLEKSLKLESYDETVPFIRRWLLAEALERQGTDPARVQALRQDLEQARADPDVAAVLDEHARALGLHRGEPDPE